MKELGASKMIEKVIQETQEIQKYSSEIKRAVAEDLKADINVKFDDIKETLSVRELEVYDNANLELKEINGKDVLAKADIELDQRDVFGNTNLERMDQGKPPLDENGRPVELHHVGQKKDGPLAELNIQEHRGSENYSKLHDSSKESEINRLEFKVEREEHWKSRAAEIKYERGLS